MTDKANLLQITSVFKTFGGIRALEDITVSLSRGSITGLIGPNGAGKTTLFNLITGIFPADSGDIIFAGESMAGKAVHERVNMGIARTFQNVELFSSMSVLENIQVGLHTRTTCGLIGSVIRTPRIRQEERQTRERSLELLDFVGLADYADQKSADLPFGWQRLLELARALASGPRLLLLDEPAAGLTMNETDRLGELIQKIGDQDTTVLLVEHDMSLTMKTCDPIIVLDQGRKIAEGPPLAVQSDEAVMEAYLGKPKNSDETPLTDRSTGASVPS